MKRSSRLVIACAAIALHVPASLALADPLDLTLVHIRCTSPGDPERSGTGVMISPDGMVLTARHVVAGADATVKPGTVCSGSLGHANSFHLTMSLQKLSNDYDAAVLKYPGMDGAEHVTYCDVEARHKRARIIAAGFPLISATGQPSERVGILSTIEPGGVEAPGLLESDASTTSGMSGGRVTFEENDQLVGIIAGVTPDPTTGYPNAYAVLSAGLLAAEFGRFGLRSDTSKCEPLSRVVTPQAATGTPWLAADGPLPLGMKADEGFCYIVKVWGDFDDPRDSVEIVVTPDNTYALVGNDTSIPGNHGAVASCVRF